MFMLGENLTQDNWGWPLFALELEQGNYFETRGQHRVTATISNERILDYAFQSGECQIRLNTTQSRMPLPTGQSAAMVDLDAACTVTDGTTSYDLSIQASDYLIYL